MANVLWYCFGNYMTFWIGFLDCRTQRVKWSPSARCTRVRGCSPKTVIARQLKCNNSDNLESLLIIGKIRGKADVQNDDLTKSRSPEKETPNLLALLHQACESGDSCCYHKQMTRGSERSLSRYQDFTLWAIQFPIMLRGISSNGEIIILRIHVFETFNTKLSSVLN